MFRRLIFFGLLALPGAFLVLTAICMHPRYRVKVAQLAGLPGLRSRFDRVFRLACWLRQHSFSDRLTCGDAAENVEFVVGQALVGQRVDGSLRLCAKRSAIARLTDTPP